MLAFPVGWSWGCAAVYILPPWLVDKSKLCYVSYSTNQHPEVAEGLWLLDNHKILWVISGVVGEKQGLSTASLGLLQIAVSCNMD